jgi:hypothetical protein
MDARLRIRGVLQATAQRNNKVRLLDNRRHTNKAGITRGIHAAKLAYCSLCPRATIRQIIDIVGCKSMRGSIQGNFRRSYYTPEIGQCAPSIRPMFFRAPDGILLLCEMVVMVAGDRLRSKTAKRSSGQNGSD